jgi:hypothetical protein
MESEMRYTKLHSMPAQMHASFAEWNILVVGLRNAPKTLQVAALDETNWKLRYRTRV